MKSWRGKSKNPATVWSVVVHDDGTMDFTLSICGMRPMTNPGRKHWSLASIVKELSRVSLKLDGVHCHPIMVFKLYCKPRAIDLRRATWGAVRKLTSKNT